MIRRLAALAIVSAGLLLPVAPAGARPLSTTEAAAMQTALDAYLTAILKNDATKIVAALPPRILKVFAGASGIEAKKLEESLVAQTAELMKGITVSDMTAQPAALDAAEAELADGTAVVWGMIPTGFIAQDATGKTRNEQPLLAVSEGGNWYFLRVDGAERQQLSAIAYPFLAAVTFPASTIVPVP